MGRFATLQIVAISTPLNFPVEKLPAGGCDRAVAISQHPFILAALPTYSPTQQSGMVRATGNNGGQLG